MIWEGNVVSLSNYTKVFKGYSSDVLEVIRGALFDCTPIEDYIRKYKNDPYMLWQVKLCIDEGIDEEWFSVSPNGEVLNSIRRLYNRGINLNPLLKVFRDSKLSSNYFKYIIKWYEKGVALEEYNFKILPESMLNIFDYGLSLNYPMKLFNNGVHFKEDYIQACLKLLSNKKSISRFLDGDWDTYNVELLAKYSKTKYYDKMIKYISKNITPSVLEEIYECSKVGMPLDRVSAVDEDELYVFGGVLISLAREAYLDKLDYTAILEPGISVVEATSILNEMRLNTSKRLSGKLRKN